MPPAVSRVVTHPPKMTPRERRARWEDTAAELIDNREDRRRAEEELQRLDEHLARLLAEGRADGLDVTAMARVADVSRTKAHKMILRARGGDRDLDRPLEWYGTDPATGLTVAAALELRPLFSQPEALRAAWTTTLERYGPAPTASQTAAIVSEVCELSGLVA